MFGATMTALIGCMVMTLGRAIAGPTVFDRILAVNSFGTKTVLFIAVLGFLTGRPDFLDLALVYALINFIGTVAVLKYTRFGDLVGMETDLDEQGGAPRQCSDSSVPHSRCGTPSLRIAKVNAR